MDCREGAKRIKEIAQNLRVFTRLDEAEFQKTDIHEGIDSTVRLLSSYFSADHINLKRDYGDLPLIDAFPGQLNQVWMNLLVNAAQALGVGGGEVTVSTTRQGESISIGISDTGPGIAPDVLDRIFDPFFTTKEVGEGTGLGLSICFSIVERHGGTIRAYSRPREGTTFTVTLPIEAESPPEIPDNAQTH
jgi:signal transduction histidine kinase